jgi:hypothetical protein
MDMKEMQEKSKLATQLRIDAGLSAHRTPMEKHEEDRTSRKKAIDAYCYECMGCDLDPGNKWKIGNCKSPDVCPLWHVRPHQHLMGKPLPKNLRSSEDEIA